MQFNSNYHCRVVIYAHGSFIRLATACYTESTFSTFNYCNVFDGYVGNNLKLGFSDSLCDSLAVVPTTITIIFT